MTTSFDKSHHHQRANDQNNNKQQQKCLNQNQLNYKNFINVLVHLIRSIIICCSACAHIESNFIKFNQILVSRLLLTSVMILHQFFINNKNKKTLIFFTVDIRLIT